MNVGCTSSVVAGEDRLELDDSLLVARLNTAQESSIQISCIVLVSITASLNARVDTSRIAVPDIDINVWQGVTSVGVDKLNVHVQRNTGLGFHNTLADQFPGNNYYG